MSRHIILVISALAILATAIDGQDTESEDNSSGYGAAGGCYGYGCTIYPRPFVRTPNNHQRRVCNYTCQTKRSYWDQSYYQCGRWRNGDCWCHRKMYGGNYCCRNQFSYRCRDFNRKLIDGVDVKFNSYYAFDGDVGAGSAPGVEGNDEINEVYDENQDQE